VKRYSKISGITIVTCDAKGCESTLGEFRTASIPKVIDAQLEAAKWTIIDTRDPKTNDKKRHELCPDHRPRPRMEGGPPPLVAGRDGRSSH
jgi:hypothetical protein